MRVVGSDETRPCAEAVVIAHSAEAGTARHLELLSELRDGKGHVIEGVPTHTVHDLTSKMLATSKVKLAAFNEAFKGQASGATLGFLNASNCKSTNDQGKNVTGIVAIDHWPADKCTQLRGRISRVVPLEEGDVVPEWFTLLLLTSEWADALRTAMASRVSSHAKLTKPSGFDALLAKAQKAHPAQAERISAKAAQLLKMDLAKLLGESSDMALTYLTALTDKEANARVRAKYEAVRKDATFDPFEDESGDAEVTAEDEE